MWGMTFGMKNIDNPLICKTSWSQARGLMFRKKRNLIMEFNKPKLIALHMFFVFYPIDVLILNKDKEVVEIKNNFRPFTFWKSEKPGKYVVELSQKCRVNLGEKLNFSI
jgi:uncharacterized protein